MKIKENAETVGICNFLDDLFFGGYFKPRDYLIDEKDVKAVEDAMRILTAYNTALDEAGKIEIM